MQAASAFVIVQQAFSWLVDNYPKFADWTASARRVASLLVSLDQLDRPKRWASASSSAARPRTRRCGWTNLSVTLDDGTVVVNEAEVEIAPGEKVLVVGRIGHRQELARAGDRRPVAVGRRQAAAEIGRAPVHAAAAALHPDRHAAARHLLSERRRGRVRGRGRRGDEGRRPRPSGRSRSTRRSPGTRPCRAARSSASHSRGCWCSSPTSS